ncbi:MAG: type I methionyl aminopeptidase [Patescibacteria group bacterium]
MILNEQQIGDMKEGGKMLAEMLRELSAAAKPGVTTSELETLARELIKRANVAPSFLDYNGYPAVLCASVNEEAVHGVPSGRKLKEGDLLTLDFGIVHKGLHTDSAVSLIVSEDPTKKEYAEKRKLMRVTREALYAGIAAARVGNTLGDIGAAIEKVVEQDNDLTIVRELGGHGIGHTLHEEPFVANLGEPGHGTKLVEGMALALEPIVSNGDWKIKDSSDGFGYITKDRSLVAHFEHTIVITKGDPIIITE